MNQIEELIQNTLLGHPCYVQDDDNKIVECTITRVDIFSSKHGTGVNLHLKRPGIQNFPLCVNLYKYGDYNVSRLPLGFLTEVECVKFYSELE